MRTRRFPPYKKSWVTTGPQASPATPKSNDICTPCPSQCPKRCRAVRYGASYEGRGLYYLVIAKPENIEQIEQIRERNLELSDPRQTPIESAQKIAGDAPA